MKKVDIQEANKHLQLLHVRNTELEQELETKTTQLSKLEAQLEDVTRVKQNELLALTGQLDTLKVEFANQVRETEQWKMLVHERDVMIAKLQTRCRQLEELESHVYECRPSLEALLSLTYQLDGTEIDSQTAAKPYHGDAESEADYAEPDIEDRLELGQPLAPDLPLPFNLVSEKNTPENNMISLSKVKRYLQTQNQSSECDQNANKEKDDGSRTDGTLNGNQKIQDHRHGGQCDVRSDGKFKMERRTVVEISV